MTTSRCRKERVAGKDRRRNLWMNPEQDRAGEVREIGFLTMDQSRESMHKPKPILPELTGTWAILVGAVNQSIIITLLAGCKMVSGNAVAGQRTGPASSGRATSPDMDKAHAHGACSQLRHGMCVRRQLIWRRPELGPRSLPITALAEERQSRVVRLVGRRRILGGARGANEKGGK